MAKEERCEEMGGKFLVGLCGFEACWKEGGGEGRGGEKGGEMGGNGREVVGYWLLIMKACFDFEVREGEGGWAGKSK